jgi:hypothetical protein
VMRLQPAVDAGEDAAETARRDRDLRPHRKGEIVGLLLGYRAAQ